MKNPQPYRMGGHPENTFGMDTAAGRPCRPTSRTIPTAPHASRRTNLSSRGDSLSNNCCLTILDNEQEDMEGILQRQRRRQGNLDQRLRQRRSRRASISPTRVRERHARRDGDLHLRRVQHLRQGHLKTTHVDDDGAVDWRPHPTSLRADQHIRNDIRATQCDPARRREV